MSENNCILEAHDLVKSYTPKGRKQIDIIKGISLSIKAREIITIVGESGSGKTTLLNLLSTLDTPDSGTLRFNQTNIFSNQQLNLNPDQLSKLRNEALGFVFQFHHLLEDFTALENVAIPNFILSGDFKTAKNKGEYLLEQVGLKERLHHLPSELSGGEQQRVAVARALINSPKIVFADEPSGNLDSRNSQKLYELIVDLSRLHKTAFVIVTHNEHMTSIANRNLHMSDGVLTDTIAL
jgi:lipoprotein-releasing system ATP-binding protein